jgi:hypothetical protein
LDRRSNVEVKLKKTVIYIVVIVVVFAAGFFARGLFNRKRISGTAEPYQNIQNELRNAEESHRGLEEHIGEARNGIATGLELSGTIRDGLGGIEGLAVENTDLLGRAEQILLDAGERERSP